MNVKQQLIINTNQLVACFYSDRNLAVRIIIFIFTGLCALWLFIADATILWLVKMLQVPGDELDRFINNENKPAILRCVMLVMLLPIVYIRYITLPFLYMIYWLCNFCFNCFAYITSLGKSDWSTITFSKEEN